MIYSSKYESPVKKNDKNGAILCILSDPKYAIINIKINNF